MTETVVTQLIVDARGAEEGVRIFDAAMQRADKAAKGGTGSASSFETAQRRWIKSLGDADPAIRAQIRGQEALARQHDINRRAVELGIATQLQADAQMEKLRLKHLQLVEAAQQGTAAHTNMSKATTLLTSQMAGLTGVLSVGALVAYAKSALDSASALDETAEQAGVSTLALQAYRAQMRENGIEYGQTDQLLARLTRTIGDAKAGSDAQSEAFHKLGLSARDLAGGTESVLPQVARALLAIPDPSVRARLEFELFGRQGQKLESALHDLTASTGDLINTQMRMGHVLAEDVTRGADAAYDHLNSAWDAIQNRITPKVTFLAGALADLLDKLAKLGATSVTAPTTGPTATVGYGYWGGALTPPKAPGSDNPVNSFKTQDWNEYLAKAKLGADLAGLTATRRAQEQAAIEAANQKLKFGAQVVDAQNHDLLKTVTSYEQAKKVLSDTELKHLESYETIKAQAAENQKLSAHKKAILERTIDISSIDKGIEQSAQTTVDIGLRGLKVQDDYSREQAQILARGDEYLDDLWNEVRLAGMSADERERAIAVMHAGHLGMSQAQQDEVAGLVRVRQEAERWQEVVTPVEELPADFLARHDIAAQISAALQEIIA